MSSVMFVCLGNICRSPAAEAILKHMDTSGEIKIASSAIGDWHTGHPSDPRMIAQAKKRGIKMTSLAQQFHPGFFNEYELILAADQTILGNLLAMGTNEADRKKIQLINDFSEKHYGKDVPDPYYGKIEDFEVVLDMLEEACAGILKHFKKTT